jgi:hypothetical protein
MTAGKDRHHIFFTGKDKAMRSVSGALAIALLTVSAAHATPPCGAHDDQVSSLGREFGEVLQIQALSGNGTLIEMFVNPRTKTWTAMATTPDGKSCLLDAGADFQAVTKPDDPA